MDETILTPAVLTNGLTASQQENRSILRDYLLVLVGRLPRWWSHSNYVPTNTLKRWALWLLIALSSLLLFITPLVVMGSCRR